MEPGRCKSCGGPAALKHFRWCPERGVIVGGDTGRRMIMTGMELDPSSASWRTNWGRASRRRSSRPSDASRTGFNNAFPHLMVAVLVQGPYEMTFDADTNLEWSFSGRGEPEASLTPLGRKGPHASIA